MRKAIIAAIVATALFAVGAFAATFSVSAEDIASGQSDTVESCTEQVNVVSYSTTTGVTGTTAADWSIDGAVVEVVERVDRSCDGAEVKIAIGLNAVEAQSDPATWSNGSCEQVAVVTNTVIFDCDIDASAVAATKVQHVREVAVLVNGNQIAATEIPA